jgi:hypothetical protein
MTDFVKLDGWLINVSQSANQFDSLHFDEFFESSLIEGRALVNCAEKILNYTLTAIRNFAKGHGVRFAVVYLPIGNTENVEFWNPDILARLNSVGEPPALYLLRSDHVFDEQSEEYRMPISLLFNSADVDLVMFRSFRNQEAIRNSWEFTSGIYMIAKI